jgi:serine/threonine protein phosphatase PrpC
LNSKATASSDQPGSTNNAWHTAFASAAATDVGMRRSANQDSFCVTLADDRDKWDRSGHLLIVADGMGAHAAGELASRLSVDLIPHHYAKFNRGDSVRAILQALEEANSEIYRRGQANPEFRSMGTTTSALLLLPIGAIVAHVGDSRVYRLRGQTLEQLTFDHSLVWEMQASGEISDEMLKSNAVPKNVITRSLGPNANVQVDLEGPFPLQKGDRFLLCSDGLSGQLDDEEIGILLGALDIQDAVRAMIDLANIRGGPDNITVVVAEITGDELVTPNALNVSSSVGLPSSSQSNGSSSWNSQPSGNSSFPIGFGIAAAVCALTSIVLLFVQQFALAAVGAAATILAGISGWIKMVKVNVSDDRSANLGRAPYRKAQCKPTASFVKQLTSVIDELQEWVAESGIPVDRHSLDAATKLGKQSLSAKNYKQAIQQYCAVLVAIMKEARAKGNSKDDEAIDY